MSIHLKIHDISLFNSLDKKFDGKLRQIFESYESSIGGTDMGMGAFLHTSEWIILVFEGGFLSDHIIGFILGTSKFHQELIFEGEKVFLVEAAFIQDDKRDPGHAFAISKVFVELLIKEGFNRLELFHPMPGMLTAKGRKLAQTFAKIIWRVYGKEKRKLNDPRFAGNINTIFLTPEIYIQHAENERSKPRSWFSRLFGG